LGLGKEASDHPERIPTAKMRSGLTFVSISVRYFRSAVKVAFHVVHANDLVMGRFLETAEGLVVFVDLGAHEDGHPRRRRRTRREAEGEDKREDQERPHVEPARQTRVRRGGGSAQRYGSAGTLASHRS
jgi:hypothetical protein